MKHLFILAAVITVAVSASAATFTRPNMNSADGATLSAALSAAPTADNKAFVEIIMEINALSPGSFAELCSIIDRVSDKYGVGAAPRLYNKKLFAYCSKKCRSFARDAALFCAANPSSYDRVYVTGARTKKYFTKEQIYTLSRRCLLNDKLSAGAAAKLISAMIDASDVVSDATVKADLVRLNRKYSLLLVKDKTAWTPVVQAIRTAMDTFK